MSLSGAVQLELVLALGGCSSLLLDQPATWSGCCTSFSQMFFNCCSVVALDGSVLILLFPCIWKHTLDWSLENRLQWCISSARTVSLCLAVSRASFVGISLCFSSIQDLSLMMAFCISVSWLTSFQASLILASGLLLHEWHKKLFVFIPKHF